MSILTDRIAQSGILIADGATGTMLQQAGLPIGVAPERWNIENPDSVRALHRSYLHAGADVILTNTFGGTRIRLEREGLQGQVGEVNWQAAWLARQEAGDEALVFGDIGPTGKLLKPYGPLTDEEAVEAFTEQAEALARGGVDAILIETMGDLNEMKAAVEGVRRSTGLPLLATMSFDTHGHTMMGVKPEQAARQMADLGIDVIGANCGRTLSENLDAIRAMHEAVPDAVLMAKPNAGLPRSGRPEAVYDVTPQVMAEYGQKFADLGVKIIGGCCGSTPEHIQALAKALKV